MRRRIVWPRLLLAALVSAALSLTGSTALAQMSTGTGSIHGSVTNVSGAPETSGTIALYRGGMSSPDQDANYTLTVDQDGEYHGANIKAGSYTAAFRTPTTPKNQVVDQIDHVVITPGKDTQLDFDMSTEAFISKLPAAERKKIEELKKKNAGILKENKVIKSLNSDLGKARAFDKEKNFAQAEALMQKDVAIKPNAAVLWVELGMAQAGLKKWADAETSLQKGIALDQAQKKPNPHMQAAAMDKLGEALINQGKIQDAEATYDKAAQIDPTNAGMYYENETILMDRLGHTNATVAAADKAIAANPKSPIPYYLKARALVSKATINPKTQKIVAPPGCLSAYKKYLELAPNGQFASDAKQVVAEMDQSQNSGHHSSRRRR
jgi:tetratricopeptide (TPR) repeat protein